MSDEQILETPAELPTEATAKKRGRGRPPKAADASGTATAEPKKPTAKRKAKVVVEVDETALAKQIEGLHKVVALMSGLPELALDSLESSMLATSVAAVQREFGMAVSSKTTALIGLVATAGIVYVPRAAAIGQRVRVQKARQQAEAEAAQQAAAAQVPAIVPTQE